MRIPGLKRLKMATRWLRSRVVGGALILGYHRVAEDDRDPYGNCVSPQHFAEQLAVLRQSTRVMRLHELVLGLQHGRVPRKAVAIAFDDGYADNLYTARPLLERYEVPGTVFIATGYMGRAFWWDELASILLGSTALPKRLFLPVAGGIYQWEADDTAKKPAKSAIPAAGQRLLWSLYHRLQPLPTGVRQQALQHLRAWAGVEAEDRSAPRGMVPAEVMRLAEDGLVEIGAHSVTHPLLATLAIEAQQSEIQQSKQHLEQLLVRPVHGFAYPHGSATPSTRHIVQETGFAWACASFNDVAWSGSNPFNLPRFWVPDWDGARFSQWLERWVNG
jgi:peptidoglycan/xylan/chitin deacetylase (PgdA/CDA1 family)